MLIRLLSLFLLCCSFVLHWTILQSLISQCSRESLQKLMHSNTLCPARIFSLHNYLSQSHMLFILLHAGCYSTASCRTLPIWIYMPKLLAHGFPYILFVRCTNFIGRLIWFRSIWHARSWSDLFMELCSFPKLCGLIFQHYAHSAS